MTKQKRRNRSNVQNGKQMRDSVDKMTNQPVWLWGVHAVQAALANPRRTVKRLLATPNAARRLGLDRPEVISARDIDKLLPSGAVHQGVAVQTMALATVGLDELIDQKPRCVAVLDQISDPHNLGAVWRSAAAFGVEAIILQTRHSPPITGLVAKSAAGAVETVSECRVVNIARALDALGSSDYVAVGMAGEAEAALGDVLPNKGHLALVFGAEGSGLRPAVAKACTWLAKIPMSEQMESLNISNAAAIAFYEAARVRSS